MKKLALILALMMVPFSAFALDTISDSDLNDVTGQAGVSILINSVMLIKSAVTSGYGDEGNWINIGQQNETSTTIGFHSTVPFMIDIVSMAGFSGAGITGIGTTGVVLTLPDMIEIQSSGQEDVITLNTTAGDTANGVLINRYKSGGTTKIVANINDATYSTLTGLTVAPANTMIVITNH
jgi:hypothetical protein